MTIRDLIRQDICIDVYDDVCEELAICFCGPQPLTDEGKKEFEDIMDFEVTINPCSYAGLPAAIVHVDDPDEKVWQRKLAKAKTFFDSAAGYCRCSVYEKWFGK